MGSKSSLKSGGPGVEMGVSALLSSLESVNLLAGAIRFETAAGTSIDRLEGFCDRRAHLTCPGTGWVDRDLGAELVGPGYRRAANSIAAAPIARSTPERLFLRPLPDRAQRIFARSLVW